MMFNSDTPINSAQDDILGRSSFAASLAKAMLAYSSQEAFTIGLYGPWGSGKTSVINLLIEQLQEQERLTPPNGKAIVFRFNPWMCTSSEQMIEQFFTQLSAVISPQSSVDKAVEGMQKITEVASALNEYAGMFNFTRLIPGIGSIPTILEMLGKGSELYQNIIGDKNKLNLGNLQESKDKIRKLLLEFERKIIVVIDDMDRLSKDEIIAVFRLVKSLADFPYMIYLLAFDYPVVVGALDEVQCGNGEKYLEKIIQVPFELPKFNEEDICKILQERIISMVSEENYDLDIWNELFSYGLQGCIRSIRDVTRYMNIFGLKYAMLKDEVDIIDLIGITYFQVFQPQIFTEISLHKYDLCGTISPFTYKAEENSKRVLQLYDNMLKTVLDEEKDSVEYILKLLFPKLVQENEMISYRMYNEKLFLLKRNIAHEQYFERYFTLALEKDALPYSKITWLLLKSDKVEFGEYILKQLKTVQENRFMNEVLAYCSYACTMKERMSSSRAKLLLEWIVELWEDIETNWNSSLFTSKKFRIIDSVEGLLNFLPQEERYTVLENIFTSSNVSEYTLCKLLTNLESRHNQLGRENKNNMPLILTLNEVKHLEIIYIKRSLEKLHNSTLFSSIGVKKVFQLLEEIDLARAHLSRMRTEVNQHIHNNAFLANLATVHTWKEQSIEFGNECISYWQVDISIMKKYIDVDMVAEQLEKFMCSDASNQLEQDTKKDVAAFLIAIELPPFRNLNNERITEEMVMDKVQSFLNESTTV